jgi:hypothetical protein
MSSLARFENFKIFSSTVKNNAGVLVVNSKVIGLVPGYFCASVYPSTKVFIEVVSCTFLKYLVNYA